MPIHEYACRACGHEFEALTRSSSPAQCPRCHALELEKKLSVFATPASTAGRMPERAAGPCGTCGSPAGPGSCAWQGEAATSP